MRFYIVIAVFLCGSDRCFSSDPMSFGRSRSYFDNEVIVTIEKGPQFIATMVNQKNRLVTVDAALNSKNDLRFPVQAQLIFSDGKQIDSVLQEYHHLARNRKLISFGLEEEIPVENHSPAKFITITDLTDLLNKKGLLKVPSPLAAIKGKHSYTMYMHQEEGYICILVPEDDSQLIVGKSLTVDNDVAGQYDHHKNTNYCCFVPTLASVLYKPKNADDNENLPQTPQA